MPSPHCGHPACALEGRWQAPQSPASALGGHTPCCVWIVLSPHSRQKTEITFIRPRVAVVQISEVLPVLGPGIATALRAAPFLDLLSEEDRSTADS